MEFDRVATTRRMARAFLDEPIPDDIVDRVLQCALTAPSAGFTQGVDLLVLADDERRAHFWDLASTSAWRNSDSAPPLTDAPVIILPICDQRAYVDRYGEADKARSTLSGADAAQWPVPYWLVDSAFMVMLILLQATNLGLGALFFRLHATDSSVLSGLGVPQDRSAIGAIALGYRASNAQTGSPTRRPRRGGDVIHHERW